MTAPHIGNTGTNDEDMESRQIWVAGYVVRDPSRVVSNFRAQRSLDDDLVAQGVVGHQRHRHPRRHPPHPLGRRHARRHLLGRRTSSSATSEQLELVRGGAEMAGRNLSAEVSTPEPLHGPRRRRAASARSPCSTSASRRRRSNNLAARGFDVHVLPQMVTRRGCARARAVARCSSRTAPATPRPPTTTSRCCRRCCAPACRTSASASATSCSAARSGFGTYKLPFGHRGINQPVLDKRTGRVEITAQNHGFAVDAPIEGDLRLARRLRPRRGQPLQPQRQRGRGPQLPRHPRVQRAVPPGGGGRPARRQLPLRPVPAT